MGQAKYKFDLPDVELANFSRALALPARVTIIRILLEQEDWVDNSRFNDLPLAAEVKEKHLNALKTMKLIRKMTRGGHTFYQLNHELFKSMTGHLSTFISEIASHKPQK